MRPHRIEEEKRHHAQRQAQFDAFAQQHGRDKNAALVPEVSEKECGTDELEDMEEGKKGKKKAKKKAKKDKKNGKKERGKTLEVEDTFENPVALGSSAEEDDEEEEEGEEEVSATPQISSVRARALEIEQAEAEAISGEQEV
eukprot:SAG11_NODE_191_length_12943_cov_3.853706_2_plen_142_part_00